MHIFSTDHMPPSFADEARLYRKTPLTKMLRINGPFRVETSEGPLECQDGYIAVNARGYPYPIAADEQELIYELVVDLEGGKHD